MELKWIRDLTNPYKNDGLYDICQTVLRANVFWQLSYKNVRPYK